MARRDHEAGQAALHVVPVKVPTTGARALGRLLLLAHGAEAVLLVATAVRPPDTVVQHHVRAPYRTGAAVPVLTAEVVQVKTEP